jgi:large subunit ribosomal protein L3
MTLKLLGKKVGMTRLFDSGGNVVVCSVIKAEPNVVSQVIQQGNYKGIQLAAISMNEAKQRNVSKPLQGHFAKAGIQPKRYLHQCAVEDISSYQIGSSIGLEFLEDTKFVDISGVSKGKGYQGVMKRHNFAGGPAAHGSSFHRHAGSTGQRTTPGRCLPGVKKAGHMGSEKVTVQNLRVVQIDKDNNLILVEGAVPGPKNGVLYVSKSIKKSV